MKKKKKSKKMRGHTTYGYGSKKKHRGSGNRGGKGMAGTGKRADSKKPSVWNMDYFGKHGFVKKNKKPVKSINMIYLEQNIESLVKKGLATNNKGLYEVDMSKLGFHKVLSTGKITKKFKITASSFSERAKENIEQAGGQAIKKEVSAGKAEA